MTIHCDNTSAIRLARNPICPERTKHEEVDCHFTGEKIQSKDVEKSYISIGDQVADFLTKAVGNVSPDSVIDIENSWKGILYMLYMYE